MCPFGDRARCWVQKGNCEKGDRSERKIFLQNLCLIIYEEKILFPPAFKNLLNQIDLPYGESA